MEATVREPSGVLILYKPQGITSHDAVYKIRRLFGTKRVGHTGTLDPLSEGVIVAKRHIHMTTADAAKLNVTDKEIVNVKIETEGRSLVFGDVVVRVNDSFALAMHIDTDEANACSATAATMGEIVK